MSTFSITSIDGKKCTAVRKAQVAVTTTSSSSSSLSTSSSFSTSTSTSSTFTSIAVSTTFSTSSTSISTPAAATSTSLPDTFLNAPELNTPTSAVQEETLTTPAPTSDAPSGASISTSLIIGAGGAATATTTGPGQLESSEAGPSLTNGAQNNSTGSAISTQTTVAVAGGVIGGLALISIIAFLLWFWRKRLMKKRRSTLLTPLTNANYRGGEKGPYVISRNSLGPTTIPEKVRAMVGYNYHRLRGRVNSLVTRSPKPSVDMNRGNSQFGLPSTPLSRSASRATAPSTEAMTTKDKFVDWWGRLTEDGNLNWKLRNDASKGGRANNDTYTSMPSTAQARKKGSQPDFLTLLSMDEKQQQTLSNNTTGSSGNPRRSQSLGNEHFLGGLGLNFDVENPFADSNAMRHDSAKVMPLAVPRAEASNPFSDANAIPGQSRPPNNATAGGPANYVQNIRRSRGYSVSAANTRPPSGATTTTTGRVPSLYRESSLSVETSDTRRNKFRSDPFDLDRPELLVQSPGSSTRGVAGSSNNSSSGRYSGNAAQGLPNMPRPTHARGESFTSKYSSGVSSMGDWSDPGPDVGPAAGRWDTPSPDGALGRQPPLNTIGLERGRGGGSQRSVGKAM
ncbi:hypothetical protein GGR51DRAFT_227981 [Nemania sp. FL0031]|nr:hypothetical protein GGR51DRAFT_227981 [Nemania sp. FL0031]